MRTASLIIGVLLTAACASSAPGQSWGSEAEAALDQVLRGAVGDGSVPGIVGLVTSRDSVLYRGAFGVMDARGEEPMQTDPIFSIASMTKPVTSVGVMMLVDRGLLGLDDAASDYLPELERREVLEHIDPADSTVSTRPAARPVTVRDLLRHTSGFGYAFSSEELLQWTRITGRPGLEQPLLHDPGDRWTYGSSTYFLGRIIEEVTGERLDNFLDSRIFGPLGMNDTSFSLAAEDVGRLAAAYRRRDGGLEGEPRPETYEPQIRGDYGLLSTADDYARFVRLILGEGEVHGTRLLSSEAVVDMTRDHLPDVTVTEQPGAIPATSNPFPLGAGHDGFGLGFQVDAVENPSPRSAGSLSWAGIRNTHFWIDPTSGLGVVLLTQIYPFYDGAVIDVLTTFEETLYEYVR